MHGFASLTAAILLTVGLLTGCDESGPRTQVIYTATMGSLTKLRFEAQSGRSVPVFAVNAPFSSDSALAAEFATLLKGDDPHLKFEGAGGGIPESMERPWVLVLNDTPQGYTGISACQGKPYDPVESTGQFEFRMVICNDAARLVEVLAILPAKETDRQTAYQALMRQAVRDLLVGEDQTPR